MKAAIFNPYLDTVGGGERYSMSFAKVLKDHGYEVDVQWKNSSIQNKLEMRFGINLDGFNFVKDIKRGDGYDICFWVSDGSIPLLRARKNFLHFQIPFKDVNGRSLINKMKLYRINKIICNSYFTKSFIDQEYGVESVVVYPPIDVLNIKSKRKENIILFVGRFSQLTQAKNQHILIESFKKISKKYSDWKLVLAGGTDVGVDDYVNKLRKSSKTYPVEIIENPTFDKIKILYGVSKIFWSASGYSAAVKREPTKVEHFGISVVEAMSGGVVPVVYDAGGHKEIIAEGTNGFLWKSTREFIRKTKILVNNPKLLHSLSTAGRESAKVYEYERFESEILQLI
ncbi:hypothetical protein A2714_05570 [Candidatus Woesebacteria bacterium RIFCSPHIGHO2_01_FULL_38_9]|uniref:Glycosyl transferase family 1 domain-containing protein n=1 Tax=Candidatus Woesebacteria bacterium RIFCSPHIGHO2_01_FULL_38_9 TaxID=1802492 RepID=A0A1F7Y523_9BACT|nr:MAG: hypothetical protein A2714_05570 [Candidatus Woesebacteria bacterium RIFCSPHIGHO2_01_FULL_38_9]